MKKLKKDDYAALRKKRKNCKTCRGFGLWAIGNSSPMGPMDAADGMPTKVCPECGAGQRKNTWTTLEGLTIPVKDLTDSHLKNIVKHLEEREMGKSASMKMIKKEVKRRKLK